MRGIWHCRISFPQPFSGVSPQGCRILTEVVGSLIEFSRVHPMMPAARSETQSFLAEAACFDSTGIFR
jgi:hypothetical protein